MCTAKAPKTPEPEKPKPVVYMSNPWLDGGGSGDGTVGRNALRQDMTGAAQRVPMNILPPAVAAPVAVAPVAGPVASPTPAQQLGMQVRRAVGARTRAL